MFESMIVLWEIWMEILWMYVLWMSMCETKEKKKKKKEKVMGT
jgi:predicted membrane protein